MKKAGLPLGGYMPVYKGQSANEVIYTYIGTNMTFMTILVHDIPQ